MKSQANLGKPFIFILSILIAIIACTGSNSAVPTTSPADVATVVAATMQAIQAQATPTSNPPTPTASPAPAASPTISLAPPTQVRPAATRINFLTGATSGIVSGTIQPNQILYYVFNASQGQPIIAQLDSTNHDVTMTIKTAGGTSLLNNGQNLNTLLPITEDYYVTVLGSASSENFSLTIETPARITFDPGKTKAVMTGKTAGGLVVSYVLYAKQDQYMDVYLNGVAQDGALTIYGFADGQPYVRSVTGATHFSMKLPRTQDYIIDIVPSGGMVVGYTLVINVQ